MFLLSLMADGFGWISDHATILATVVAAIAAVWVARFTVVLARVTGEQARLTNEGIKLARDEFNATHRPEIAVHFVEQIWGAERDKDGKFYQPLKVNVTYFNKGSVPARDVEIRGIILFLDVTSDLGAGFGEAPILPRFDKIVEAGRPYVFEIHSEIGRKTVEDEVDMAHAAGTTVKKTPYTAYCYGAISYSDSADVKRQTGFIWRYKAPMSWVREAGSPLHYEY